MEYEKKYKAALERAEIAHKDTDKHIKATIERIFPELCESEDERIRKAIIELLKEVEEDETYTGRQHIPDMLAYLEKQKEQSLRDFIDDFPYSDEQKEQKPAATINGEPIPTENHSVDIPLAEWGEEDEKFFATALWHISYSASNGKSVDWQCDTTEWLKGVKERLKTLRQQPKQEWSKEDKDNLNNIIWLCENCETGIENVWLPSQATQIKNLIKSLRPSWKPSEDEKRLINTSISFLKDFADKGYENAVECIDWLKSKLSCLCVGE